MTNQISLSLMIINVLLILLVLVCCQQQPTPSPAPPAPAPTPAPEPTLLPTPEPSPTPKEDETEGSLPDPLITENSVELCLNSRYSDHSLSGTASDQQLANVLWAAGRVPITGGYRNIYVSTGNATYLYDPSNHSLSLQSGDITDEGAFVINWESELLFDAGLIYMPALLASVSLRESTESDVSSCPKLTSIYFGVQEVGDLTSELVAHSSVPEGEPGWLPDPATTGDNRLEEVLANLKYVDNFAPTNLTLQQISQILWAGYGCTPHEGSFDRMGLTVPSARAAYYLTGKIYFVNENGVYRYHNRTTPGTDLTTRDHRIKEIESDDVRDSLLSAVRGLPQAPFYVILCLESSDIGDEVYAELEVGFVASNMLIQASAIDLGCYFKTKLTSDEQGDIQNATSIPSSHLPQAIVSIGPLPPKVTVTLVSPNSAYRDRHLMLP